MKLEYLNIFVSFHGRKTLKWLESWMLKLAENFIKLSNYWIFVIVKKITPYLLMLILFGLFFTPILAHEREDPIRVLEVGEKIPNFNLKDQDGRDFNIESAHGKVVLLSFLYTNCPDVCPLQTTKMRQTQELIGDTFEGDVVFVSISFDVADTPEILKAYALYHQADLTSWKFLGSQDEHEIKDVVESFGIMYDESVEGLFSHGMFMYLLDTDLRINKLYLGTFLDPIEVANDISELLPSPPDLTISIIAVILAGIAIVGLIVFFKRKK